MMIIEVILTMEEYNKVSRCYLKKKLHIKSNIIRTQLIPVHKNYLVYTLIRFQFLE